MPETIQTLGDLSTLKPVAAPEPPKYVQKLDKQGRAYATGKRKNAIMSGMVTTLTEKDMEAIASFYSKQVGLCDTKQILKNDGQCKN